MPLAAQLACTPVVAAISGQVSLVAVAANLLVAPGGGARDRARPRRRAARAGLGTRRPGWPGTLAAWCVAWIIVVAERGAALPAAAIGWGTGALSLAALTAVVVGLALASPRLLRRPVTGLGCCLVLVVAVLVRPGDLGWPPRRLGAGRLRRRPGRRAGAATPGRARPSWWTPGRTPRWWTAAWTGSTSSGSRCWCSPTSTPTTSTGSRACWTAARSERWWSPGCWTRRRGSRTCSATSRAGGRSCRGYAGFGRPTTYGAGLAADALAAAGPGRARPRRRLDGQRRQRRAPRRDRRAPDPADRRRRAARPGEPGPDAAGARGRRAEDAAPRQRPPGRGLAALPRSRGGAGQRRRGQRLRPPGRVGARPAGRGRSDGEPDRPRAATWPWWCATASRSSSRVARDGQRCPPACDRRLRRGRRRWAG